MAQGLTNKQYPSQIDTFTTWENDVDSIRAEIINDIQDQIVTIETELGTEVAGSMIDLKTRLAVSLNDDGTLKGSVQGATGLQGIQGNTGLQGPQGDTGLQGPQGEQGLQGIQGNTGLQGIQGITGSEGPSNLNKKTITVTNIDGTFLFDFTEQGFVDYIDTDYVVYLTPVGTNATKCWAVVSGSKTTSGFAIACMTSGTNGTSPYNASQDGGGNVDIDVISVHI